MKQSGRYICTGVQSFDLRVSAMGHTSLLTTSRLNGKMGKNALNVQVLAKAMGPGQSRVTRQGFACSATGRHLVGCSFFYEFPPRRPKGAEIWT